MQSLIEAAVKLEIQCPVSKAQQAYNDGINDVIALIKQHEQRPVDELELRTKVLDMLVERCGGNWARTCHSRAEGIDASFDVLRPYLKQQQPVSAEVVAVLKDARADLAASMMPGTPQWGIVERLGEALAAMQANITAKE